MKEEEVIAFIKYANANAGEIRTTQEITNGVEAILKHPMRSHIPANFTAERALEPKGTRVILFESIKKGYYTVLGESRRKSKVIPKLDIKVFFEEYCSSELLRKTLHKGEYRYFDGYLVKISPKHAKDSRSFLVERRNELDKCSITFFSHDDDSKMLLSFMIPYTKEELDDDYAKIRKRYKTLGQFFKEIQEEEELTIVDVSARTGLSEAIIDRIRNDRSKSHELLTMVKLCAGLDVEPKVAKELFRLAGVALTASSTINRAYEIVIDHMQSSPNEMKEKYLKDLGIPALGIRD